MRHSPNEYVPAALTLIAGIVTLAIAVIFKNQLPLDNRMVRPVGFAVLYGGIGLTLWSAAHIRSAIGGLVSTPLDKLVTSGPYRMSRHPVYLGTTIAMVGVAIVTRSLYGLLAVFVLFIPVEWHRARLEDEALGGKFGQDWFDYARHVGAFIPGLGKVRSDQSG